MSVPVIIYTLLEYQTLAAAIATGTKEVTYGDKKVVYRDLNDMIRILAIMKAQLFPNYNSGRKYASFSKGTFPNRRRCR